MLDYRSWAEEGVGGEEEEEEDAADQEEDQGQDT
jgi:hypothetical protein